MSGSRCRVVVEQFVDEERKVHGQQTKGLGDRYFVLDCNLLRSIWNTKNVKVLSLAVSQSLGASLNP